MEFERVKVTSVMASKILRAYARARANSVTICEAYKKPSLRKLSIYNYWQEYAYRVGKCTCFSIASYNSMIFSLVFGVQNFDGKIDIYYITPSHNYKLED